MATKEKIGIRKEQAMRRINAAKVELAEVLGVELPARAERVTHRVEYDHAVELEATASMLEVVLSRVKETAQSSSPASEKAQPRAKRGN